MSSWIWNSAVVYPSTVIYRSMVINWYDQRPESSIIIELPPNWCYSRWMGFTLCVSLDAYKGPRSYYTNKYGVRARVVALGEMPRSHYTSEIFLGWHLFKATFVYCFCLVMIGLLLFKTLNAVRLRLYLRALFHTRLWMAVGSVWCTSKIWKSSTKQMHNEAVVASLLLRIGMVPIMNLTIQK